jgi:hypothetical protein
MCCVEQDAPVRREWPHLPDDEIFHSRLEAVLFRNRAAREITDQCDYDAGQDRGRSAHGMCCTRNEWWTLLRPDPDIKGVLPGAGIAVPARVPEAASMRRPRSSKKLGGPR